MSFTVLDLKPKREILILDKEYKLSLITLNVDLDIKESFGSITEMFEAINKKPQNLLKAVWFLVQENISFKDFTEAVYKKYPSVQIGSLFTKILESTLKKSMPAIKNAKRMKEIAQINDTGEVSGEPCYGDYYDTVASRYGYTIEQFYELTLGQLHILLKVIGNKKYEELELQANLAGRKLKPRMKVEDISEEQDAENEEQAMDALKRLQEEYKKNQEGK